MSSPRSPLSVVFLLHIALEAPLAIQGIWAPASLPFLQLNNTTLIVLKLYAALVLGSCLTALLCFNLPEFLPGKRGFAIGLFVYHSICSTILIQAPRFVPHTFGALAESFKITPEVLWGSLHGFMSLAMLFWWQGTLHYGAALKKQQ